MSSSAMSPTHSATEGVRARSTPAGELREFFATAMESITPQLTFRRLIDGGDVVAVFDLIDGRITRSKIYREGSADA